MEKLEPSELPAMLYADAEGTIYEHPYYRMAGFSGARCRQIRRSDLLPMPGYSKLFFVPGCAPIGIDPDSGECSTVREAETLKGFKECFAVAAFLEPGMVRSHLPAVDYSLKSYTLPMWGYTAVGAGSDDYQVAGFWIEYNARWDPRNYDDREVVSAIQGFETEGNRLTQHLIRCATEYHCFAAKNLFLGRWEAPLPVSRSCNAACLGCLSLQSGTSCPASQERLSFRPSSREIVSLATRHLREAPEAVVSFGQGCEGEPLTECDLVAESIRQIRKRTARGTINLNTNGSRPESIRIIAESGLDSIRISLNSARPALYRAYYRPRDYDFDDVVQSIVLSRELGLYTMINYLVFPGVTDQEAELEALSDLIRETGIQFIHLKNLCIDPQLYLEALPEPDSETVGLRQMVVRLKADFPDVAFGYFNQPVR